MSSFSSFSLLLLLPLLSLLLPLCSSASSQNVSKLGTHSVTAELAAKVRGGREKCVGVGEEVEFVMRVRAHESVEVEVEVQVSFVATNFVYKKDSLSSSSKRTAKALSTLSEGDQDFKFSLSLSPSSSSSSFSFIATVASPFPVGPSIASLHASVHYGGLFIMTDDPSTPALSDATSLCVATHPNVDIVVEGTEVTPASGAVSATKVYHLTVKNSGNQMLSDVVLLSRVNEDFTFSQVTTDPEGLEVSTYGKKTFVTIGKMNVDEKVSVGLTLPIPSDYSLANLRENFRVYFSADGKHRHSKAVHMKNQVSDTNIDPVDVILSAKLLYDADGDAMADPGDIIQYSLILSAEKPQAFDFEIQLPSMLSLPPSSVIAPTASFKEILANSLHVRWPSKYAEVHLLFSAVVGPYLPGEFSQVCVQGTVNRDIPTSTLSLPEGPTCTPIDGFTKVYASKRVRSEQPYIHAGEEVVYEVHIENSGSRSATNTHYQVELDHLSYVPNSFHARHGSPSPKAIYTHGSTLRVDIGDLAGVSSYDFEYRALVDDLLVGVSQISSQGEVVFESRSLVGSDHVTGKQVVRTDDPSTVTPEDATVTPVLPSDCEFEYSVVSLEADKQSNVPVGGEIHYTVVIDLIGTIDGEVYYVNEIPLGLNLNVGTVSVVSEDCTSVSRKNMDGDVKGSRGSSSTCCNIIEGNNYGDTRIVVRVEGSSLTLTYSADVSDPYNGPESQISNQGYVMIDGKTKYSDDPTTAPLGDPTVSHLTITGDQYTDIVGVMTASLEVDLNNNGAVDPGDTLRYTVDISNQGTLGAAGVVFKDTLDTHTTLVIGTTTSTCGDIENANISPDYESPEYPEDVVVIVGGILPSNSEICTFTFDAQVNPSLPSTTTKISNQGHISGINIQSLVTTDGSGAWNAPTVVPVVGTVSYSFTKSASIALDWNWNGKADPGDGIKYTIVFHNFGSHDMTSGVFADYPDLNTNLVVGSVTTTSGLIQSGNRIGDDEVIIDISSVPALTGTFTVTFMVLINDPFSGTADAVYNQASLSVITYNDLSGNSGPIYLVTSDDSTTIVDSPTKTPVVAAPAITVVTSVDFSDANGDDAVNPGETLHYTIVVSNMGNQDAIGVSIVDTIDPNTLLVIGSVKTSQGLVVIGNSVKKDGKVIQIDAGDLAGHTGVVTYSFSVVVNKQFAGGANISNAVTVSGSNFVSTVQTSTDVEAPVLPVNLALTETWELFLDADNSGSVTPGDTIMYTVTAVNLGGGVAMDTVLSSTVDPNSSLDIGSVTISQGNVTSGLMLGDSTPQASIGSLFGYESATLTYAVTIVSSFPPWITSLSTQATATGSNFDPFLSTDPSQRILFYPTVIPVTSSPSLVFTKTWDIDVDTGLNGVVNPGDTIQYTLTIENVGNQAAANIIVTDLPQTTLLFVAGSVVTSSGTILYGNGADLPGDAPMNNRAVVSIPEIAAGESVVITFDVSVPTPYLGVAAMGSNQASLTGGNVPNMISDDPTTNFINDPTVFEIAASPSWLIDTSFTTLNPLPGASQVFLSEFTNQGNQQAYDISVTYTFGGYWSVDGSQPIVFTPSSCCQLVFTESSAHNGPLLSRVAVIATSASVPVGSNFSVQMNIVGDLGSAPRRCSQPQFANDLTECMSIRVTVSGSQFANSSVSVVDQPSSRTGLPDSFLVPNVPMTLGSKRKVSQEIVGLDGHVTMFPDEMEEGGAVSYGKRVHIVVDGRVQTRLGADATLEMVFDPSLVIDPETVTVTGLNGQVTTRSDNVVVVNFPQIASADVPSSLSVSLEAIAMPNFDGVVPLDNRVLLSNGRVSVELPESTPLNVRGNGRRSVKEHNERKTKTLSRTRDFSVAFGVFGLFAVILGVFGFVLIKKMSARRRSVRVGEFERDD